MTTDRPRLNLEVSTDTTSRVPRLLLEQQATVIRYARTRIYDNVQSELTRLDPTRFM
jgi:hypothetical protein